MSINSNEIKIKNKIKRTITFTPSKLESLSDYIDNIRNKYPIPKELKGCDVYEETFDTLYILSTYETFQLHYFIDQISKYLKFEFKSSFYDYSDQKIDQQSERIDKLEKILLKAFPPDTPERRKIIFNHYTDEEKCIDLLKN
mgnify:CR=1 FL=1